MQGFGGRMMARVAQVGSPLVVGLDPHDALLPRPIRAMLERDPAGALERWATGALEAVAEHAAAVKPQAAFFEAHGAPGVAALARVCGRARELGVPVVLDAKRGDIGSTAEAYARATLDDDGPMGADAVTLSPYLGPESLAPFVRRARSGKGLFVLLRTSNPGAGAWQDGMASEVAGWIRSTNAELGGSPGPIGAVVGATVPGAAWRERLGDAWVLAPGIGAQGAGPRDLEGHRAPWGGVLPVAARSVLFGEAPEGEEWTDRVRERAREHAISLAFLCPRV